MLYEGRRLSLPSVWGPHQAGWVLSRAAEANVSMSVPRAWQGCMAARRWLFHHTVIALQKTPWAVQLQHRWQQRADSEGEGTGPPPSALRSLPAMSVLRWYVLHWPLTHRWAGLGTQPACRATLWGLWCAQVTISTIYYHYYQNYPSLSMLQDGPPRPFLKFLLCRNRGALIVGMAVVLKSSSEQIQWASIISIYFTFVDLLCVRQWEYNSEWGWPSKCSEGMSRMARVIYSPIFSDALSPFSWLSPNALSPSAKRNSHNSGLEC